MNNKSKSLSEKSLVRGELIGLKVRIPGQYAGRIIDETKNLIVLETSGNKRKKILKPVHVFEFIVEEKIIIIDGKKLTARPEDRIKLK